MFDKLKKIIKDKFKKPVDPASLVPGEFPVPMNWPYPANHKQYFFIMKVGPGLWPTEAMLNECMWKLRKQRFHLTRNYEEVSGFERHFKGGEINQIAFIVMSPERDLNLVYANALEKMNFCTQRFKRLEGDQSHLIDLEEMGEFFLTKS